MKSFKTLFVEPLEQISLKLKISKHSGVVTARSYAMALKDGDRNSVVIKHVKLPDQSLHPRGWNTDLSHQRKIRSYQVETTWYSDWAELCDDSCRIPHSLALESSKDEFLIVLEDLDASGFPVRKDSASMVEMQTCLKWLANLHAIFMDKEPAGLWPVGTYWHLDTRPDELDVMEDFELKQAATRIDQKLSSSPYQTFVHGDAKLANFCFFFRWTDRLQR